MFMKLFCRHKNWGFICRGWEKDKLDEYISSNTGGLVKMYKYDLMRCECGKENRRYTGKYKVI